LAHALVHCRASCSDGSVERQETVSKNISVWESQWSDS
jgi:hypothetical protein